VSTLPHLPQLASIPQPEVGITYAAKITRAEANLDWRRPAIELDRGIRAFDPFPGAWSNLGDTTVKIWQATVCEGNGAPGEVLAADPAGIVVATGAGALRLQSLQRPGSKRLAADEFLRGFSVRAGERFAPTEVV
jgi:methionyl-tRNA formyltransferase